MTSPLNMRRLLQGRREALFTAVFLILLLSAGFAVRSHGLSELDYLFDEYADLSLAVSIYYEPNPFEINNIFDDDRWIEFDQARLSHYMTASLFWLGLGNEASRMLSIIFGVLTILVTYLFGRDLFNRRTGLIAASLLTFSLYHISFSRLVMTSGDSIFLFFYLTAAYFFYLAMKKESFRWLLACGIFTGLAIATKFFGLFLLVVFGSAVFLRRRALFSKREKRGMSLQLPYLGLGLTAYGLLFFLPNSFPAFKLYLYLLAIPVLAVYILKLWGKRDAKPGATALFHSLVVATLSAFTFTPIHLSLHNFLGVLGWLSRWNSSPLADAPPYEHLVILLVKLGVLGSALFLVGLFILAKRRRQFPASLVLLLFGVPMLLLLLLRWKLTWYLMMVFPVAYLMAGKAGDSALERLKSSGRLPFFIGVVALAFTIVLPLYLAQDIAPYYELEGYQLGERHVGYNRAAFLSFERIRDVNNYLERSTPPDATIAVHTFDPQHGFYNYTYSNLLYYPKSDTKRYKRLYSPSDAAGKDYVVRHYYTRDAPLPATCVKEKAFLVGALEIYSVYGCQAMKNDSHSVRNTTAVSSRG